MLNCKAAINWVIDWVASSGGHGLGFEMESMGCSGHGFDAAAKENLQKRKKMN